MKMRELSHNPESIDEGMTAVRDWMEDAVLIAFDECHKMYLAMDAQEAQFFRENYPRTLQDTPAKMYEELMEWWDESCPLRFIQAVYHNESDPNAGFINLIDQCARWDDEEDEEEEDEDAE